MRQFFLTPKLRDSGLGIRYGRLLLVGMLVAFLLVNCPQESFEGDMNWWRDWTLSNFKGLSHAYDTNNEYPPGFQYFLWVFANFLGSESAIEKNIYLIKCFTIIFDFAGIGLSLYVLRYKKGFNKIAAFLLLNFAYFYNTWAWGQVDSIFSFFVFAAILAALYQKVHLSTLSYLLALSFKVQAIVFLPLLALLLVPQMIRRFKFKDYAQWLGLCLAIFAVMILPFWESRGKLLGAITGSVDRYPVLSMNAFNLWNILFPGQNLMEVSDAQLWFHLTYKQWGLLLFCFFSGIVLLPLAIQALKMIFQKQSLRFSPNQVLLTAALLPLFFFFFNTQMHERYTHPIFLFLGLYAFRTRNLLPYFLFSIAYFLNLEKVLRFVDFLDYRSLLFDQRLIACLFLVLMGILLGNIMFIQKQLKLMANFAPMKLFWNKYAVYVLLSVLIYIPIFGYLDILPIRLWDESRLAMNAYEMYHNHNWLVLHFEGQPDLWNTKPPLMIWLQVLSMRFVGINEVALRLPAAIAAFFTLAVLFFFGKNYLKDFRFAFITVLVLLVSQGYIHIHGTRTGDFDALLTLFTTAGALCFFVYTETEKTRYLYLFFIALTLAVLTKSVAALLFLPAFFFYALWQKKILTFVKNPHFYLGILLFLIPVVAYYYLREQASSGYWDAVYTNELGGRYLNGKEDNAQSFIYYIRNIVKYRFAFWWILVPIGAALPFYKKEAKLKNIALFSALCVSTLLIIISSSKTKLEWYDLPLYPFFAIICAISLHYLIEKIATFKISNIPQKWVPILSLALIFVLPYQKMISKTYLPKELATEKVDYNFGYFLQDVIKEKMPLKGERILNYGYAPHFAFYIKQLEAQKKITWKDFQKLEVGDKVFAWDPNLKKYIEENYISYINYDKNSVLRYVIEEKCE